MSLLFKYNELVTTSWQCAFKFKALLISGGYVVKSSGDGLSAFGASSDVITGSGSGANGMANNTAWFRIQSPDGQREFLFQTSSSVGQWKCRYSVSAKFTGGSPSATVAPTATDEKYLFGSSSGAFASWGPGTDGTVHWFGGVQNTAPYGFFSVAIPSNMATNAGPYSSVLIFDPLVSGSYPVADADPFVVMAPPSGSFFTFTNLTSFSANSTNAWLLAGLTGAAFQPVGAVTMTNVSSTVTYIPSNGGSDNSLFGKRTAYPLGYARNLSGTSGQTAPGGWKGISTFLMWNTQRYVPGTLMSHQTKWDRICLDDISLPWNGQPFFG